MNDDLVLDETKLPEVHHVGAIQKLKIKMKNLSKQQKFGIGIGIVLTILILIGGGIFVVKNNSSKPTITPTLAIKNPQVTSAMPEEPKNRQLPLNGEMVTETDYQKITQKRPLAIVIENHPDARPQIGLDSADIVFETLTEGGITRFIAMFYSKEPTVVGPVRSMRKYFLDFTNGFGNPVYMHIGYAESTNPEANAIGALNNYNSLGFTNIWWRASERLAPHNAYVSTKDLWQGATERGWTTSNTSNLWEFKDKVTQPSVTNPQISVDWGAWEGNGYDVVWKYNSDMGSYQRYYGEQKHTDELSKNQYAANTVLVLFTRQQLANDGTPRITVDTIGSGKALVFMDGGVVSGIWYKESIGDYFRVKDADGKVIQFNRGLTWVMVVPLDSNVTY
jgi:hypothetical protein